MAAAVIAISFLTAMVMSFWSVRRAHRPVVVPPQSAAALSGPVSTHMSNL